MTERLLDFAWHLAVLSILLVFAFVGVGLAYGAVFALLNAAVADAGGMLLASVCLAAIVMWVARHRDELVQG